MYHRANIIGSALVPSLIACALVACTDDNGSGSAYEAVYESEHFRISYQESDYSLQEVERIAARKERLLGLVCDRLESEYTDQIETRLTLGGGAYASYGMYVSEGRWYVLDDSGHEVAHIVTFACCGYPYNRFLVEGIATAVQLDLECPDAIERFRAFVDTDCPGPWCASADVPISTQLLDFSWDASYYSYLRAGAFVTYLQRAAGMSAVKALYVSSGNLRGQQLDSAFTSLFGASVRQFEDDFAEAYLTE